MVAVPVLGEAWGKNLCGPVLPYLLERACTAKDKAADGHVHLKATAAAIEEDTFMSSAQQLLSISSIDNT